MEPNSARHWYQFSLRQFFTKRRRFRFSLGTLLLVVTLIAICLGYLSFRTQHQRDAIARIKHLGGTFDFDYQYSLHPKFSPSGSSMMRRIMGDEYSQDVVFVRLNGTTVSDADLRVIGKLRKVTTIDLNQTDVSDEGLEAINGMSELDYLRLRNTKVTSEGVRHLRPPRNIELGDTCVGDDALPYLCACARLGLDGTPITSEGLKRLASAQNLERLSLQRTNVDDRVVPILAKLTTLQLLDVSKTRISGEGLFALRNALPNCRITGAWHDLSLLGNMEPRLLVDVRSMEMFKKTLEPDPKHPAKLLVLGPLITDGHLAVLELEQKDSLEVLDLRGSSVSDEGVQKLQQASPKLKIYR